MSRRMKKDGKTLAARKRQRKAEELEKHGTRVCVTVTPVATAALLLDQFRAHEGGGK